MITLPSDEAHVWRIELDVAPEHIERAMAILSEDERARANRFRGRQLQTRFARARGAVREILSRYLSCDPARLQFRYGERGKPSLEGGGGIEFNVSHSGELALCAVTRGRAVGVDVETVRADKPLERLAKRFFSAGEAAALDRLAPEERVQAFFQCWTFKEAYIKARGEGLAIPLDRFEVTWSGDSADAHLCVAGDAAESDRWVLRRLKIDAGFAAALATEANYELRITNYDGLD